MAVAEEECMSQMAAVAKVWTLEELHSLPDDGNKYELIHGELFVTPAPTDPHETIAARLTRLLDPYVAANGLGYVYRPRAVVRFEGSEVEPDLMVRRQNTTPGKEWENAPPPSLVVEIASPTTARRDRTYKRDFYMEANVAEYWLIDAERRTLTVVRPNVSDLVTNGSYSWQPVGAQQPLEVHLQDVLDVE
jgi:Uma2 family endonuclease